jgi:hypothetical protein
MRRRFAARIYWQLDHIEEPPRGRAERKSGQLMRLVIQPRAEMPRGVAAARLFPCPFVMTVPRLAARALPAKIIDGRLPLRGGVA